MWWPYFTQGLSMYVSAAVGHFSNEAFIFFFSYNGVFCGLFHAMGTKWRPNWVCKIAKWEPLAFKLQNAGKNTP